MSSILVVGSQAAAIDGSYQTLVTELSSKGTVEMQMVDRIVDGGKFFLVIFLFLWILLLFSYFDLLLDEGFMIILAVRVPRLDHKDNSILHSCLH